MLILQDRYRPPRVSNNSHQKTYGWRLPPAHPAFEDAYWCYQLPCHEVAVNLL